MKRANGILKTSLLALGTFLLLLALNSCSQDDPIDDAPSSEVATDQTETDQTDTDTNEGDTDTNEEDTTTDGPSESADITFLKSVKKASDIYDMNVIWNGYDFSSRPMYYVFVDADNKPTRGYLVNPVREFSGATKITGDASFGLNLYKFDQDITRAMDKLAEGNGEFEFDFKIDGEGHYLQKYSEESVADVINPAITLAVHEIFHIYQFSDWTFTPNTLQDEANYPITAELLEMQILFANIAKKMPAETNVDAVKKYLKMYVAIRSNEMALDPSSEKFVENMANEQEKGEGIARYIDNLLGAQVVPNFEITFSTPESYNNIDNRDDVRSEFAFGIWYGTGAAVTHMLKNQGIAIENDIKTGKTLFDIAEESLNLTSAEKAAALQQAKDEFDWAAIQQLAQRLVNL